MVQTEAAKHTTPDSIRQRIADEREQIRILTSAGLTDGPMAKALEAHYELIWVLTERLASHGRNRTCHELGRFRRSHVAGGRAHRTVDVS